MKTNFLSALFLISLGGVVLPLSAQRIDTTHITLCSPKAKAAVREVRLTGQLTTRGNSDFRQLRDLCWQLARLDLSAARVAHIPDNALHSRHRLQYVVLPEQLKSIGRQAFFACDSLQGELRIPPTVREVGTAAFSGCARLTEINLPADSLQRIGDFAFSRLTSLRRVRVGSAVPPVCAPTAFEGID
ncbi:MAG: leucine-rich repeat domain-containing protein, partial [Bacteroidaceae bacterium]|nr:leucine-rich repeat domain-containing protein [Bacteroidaceae bacterium]